jgi:hypothetical protein
VALQDEKLILPVEKESQSEEEFVHCNGEWIGNRVRERRVLEPTTSTHNYLASHDFSRT